MWKSNFPKMAENGQKRLTNTLCKKHFYCLIMLMVKLSNKANMFDKSANGQIVDPIFVLQKKKQLQNFSKVWAGRHISWSLWATFWQSAYCKVPSKYENWKEITSTKKCWSFRPSALSLSPPLFRRILKEIKFPPFVLFGLFIPFIFVSFFVSFIEIIFFRFMPITFYLLHENWSMTYQSLISIQLKKF